MRNLFFILIGILVSSSSFAMQTITCPFQRVNFVFDQHSLNDISKTIFRDEKAGLDGKFNRVIDKEDRIYFDNYNISGIYVRIVFPKEYINKNVDYIVLRYYRGEEDEILDCQSVVTK